ncbi:hypothetical protein ACIQCG_01020 [Streptomyces noursei]|uniref:hypothetical protein n=1 Tax=Streptomyces noursei TaxID=1971 RepID=UPI0037F8C508
MESDVLEALDAWQRCWSEVQQAAGRAVQTAFPLLADQPVSPGCDDLKLVYEDPGLGEGQVRIDDEGRANITFRDLPNALITQALDDMQLPYLDDVDGPATEARLGTYLYENETTHSEFEFILGQDGLGQVNVLAATIPDAAGVLWTLTEAAQGMRR